MRRARVGVRVVGIMVAGEGRSHQNHSGLQYNQLYPPNLIEDLTTGDLFVTGATNPVHRHMRGLPRASAAYHPIHNTSYEQQAVNGEE